jgi:hypothetical protein
MRMSWWLPLMFDKKISLKNVLGLVPGTVPVDNGYL